MRTKILLFLSFNLFFLYALGQERVTVVDDESCGCELYFVDGIQTTQRDGLFGFKSEDGTEIVEPKYLFVDKFHGDYCIVYSAIDSCGLIDRKGHEIVPTIYQEVNYPSDGMIRVRQGEHYGYMDTLGNLLIPFQYRAAAGFSEGVAAVLVDFDSNSMGYGYIDKSGRLAIDATYEYAYPFQEGYAIVKKYDRFGMIDHNNKEVLTIKYTALTPLTEGTFLAVDDYYEKAALFDNHFKQLCDFKYDAAVFYSEGFYVMERGGKLTFLDRNGKERFGFYDKVSGFYDGYSWVSRDDKYGIINKKGKVILPIEYDNSGYRSMEYLFSEGVFMVEKDGKYGFVDSRGKIVVPIEYESAQHCTEGLIPVQREGVWGYVDRNNKEMIPFVFQLASFFEWGRAEVVFEGETYKINPDGECVKNCKTFPKIK